MLCWFVSTILMCTARIHMPTSQARLSWNFYCITIFFSCPILSFGCSLFSGVPFVLSYFWFYARSSSNLQVWYQVYFHASVSSVTSYGLMAFLLVKFHVSFVSVLWPICFNPEIDNNSNCHLLQFFVRIV